MLVKELIELLQQLPQDARVYLGQYNGNFELSANDMVVFYEHDPIKIIIPDYEWGADGQSYRHLDEHLRETINKD